MLFAFALPLDFVFAIGDDEDDDAVGGTGTDDEDVSTAATIVSNATMAGGIMPISINASSHLGFAVNGFVKMSAAIFSVLQSVRLTFSPANLVTQPRNVRTMSPRTVPEARVLTSDGNTHRGLVVLS